MGYQISRGIPKKKHYISSIFLPDDTSVSYNNADVKLTEKGEQWFYDILICMLYKKGYFSLRDITGLFPRKFFYYSMEIFYIQRSSVPIIKFVGKELLKMLKTNVPEKFESPDWKNANYKIMWPNAVDDSSINYKRIIKDIVYSQKHNHIIWCGDINRGKRLISTMFKIANISESIIDTLRMCGGLLFDYGCGDGLMGRSLATALNVPLVLGDLQDVVYYEIRDPFVTINFDGSVDMPESPTIISMMHSIHHFENKYPPKYSPSAIISRITKVHQMLKDGGYLLIREHDVGSPTEDCRGKIATVCLTHIKYEKNESSTSHIHTFNDAIQWLNNYRLGLTSAPRMCAIIESCGFEYVSSTVPKGKDFSYYALFRKV